jgi:hypothetical protein
VATLPDLAPNADGTINTSVITRSTPATDPYYTYIDEDPQTLNPALDLSYLFNSGAAGGDSHFGFVDTPADFASMSTVSVRTYTVVSGRTDDNITLRVSIYDATETTMYAGNAAGDAGADVSGAANPSGLHTTALTLTAAGIAATKANWDAARIRVNWIYSQVMSKDAYDLRLHAVELTGTYTATNPNATVTPGVITAVAAVPTATRIAGTGATKTPSVVPVTTTAPLATVGIGARPTPAEIATTASVPAATTVSSLDATAAPAAIAATVAVPQPDIVIAVEHVVLTSTMRMGAPA